MFRDFGAKNGTHVWGFFVKNRPIWAAHPRIAFLWDYPPGLRVSRLKPHTPSNSIQKLRAFDLCLFAK